MCPNEDKIKIFMFLKPYHWPTKDFLASAICPNVLQPLIYLVAYPLVEE